VICRAIVAKRRLRGSLGLGLELGSRTIHRVSV
jgi:hypothetical protein